MLTTVKADSTQNFEKYISLVHQAATAEEAWASLSNFAHESKLHGICCKCFPSEAENDKRVFFSSTSSFDTDLSALLNNSEPSNDPILSCSLQAIRPFRWLELRKQNAATNLDAAWEKKLSEFGDAIVVPVYGPLIRHGYFCFVEGDESVNYRYDENFLHVLSQVSYLRMCELFFNSIEKKPQLSPRECEVIRRVAKGKSNSEIATGIGVSVRTVETYLVRIYDKLGVRDRVRASLRAYALGLVV